MSAHRGSGAEECGSDWDRGAGEGGAEEEEEVGTVGRGGEEGEGATADSRRLMGARKEMVEDKGPDAGRPGEGGGGGQGRRGRMDRCRGEWRRGRRMGGVHFDNGIFLCKREGHLLFPKGEGGHGGERRGEEGRTGERRVVGGRREATRPGLSRPHRRVAETNLTEVTRGRQCHASHRMTSHHWRGGLGAKWKGGGRSGRGDRKAQQWEGVESSSAWPRHSTASTGELHILTSPQR